MGYEVPWIMPRLANSHDEAAGVAEMALQSEQRADALRKLLLSAKGVRANTQDVKHPHGHFRG
jgi:hypothetical protein